MAEPTITFGASQSFGALTGWNEQTSTVSVSSDRATAQDRIGNESASKLHNEGTTVSTPYESSSATVIPDLPSSIGALVNSLILTGISVQTKGDAVPAMTLTGHNHTTNAHSSSPALKSVAHSIAIGAAFGATDFIGGTAGSNAAAVSGDIDITCDHKDETGALGEHLVGENYHPMITAKTEWIGVPTTAAGAGWDKVSVETKTDANGFLRTTVSATKKLTFT